MKGLGIESTLTWGTEMDSNTVPRGYFGIGVENLKTGANLGTLWRSAHSLGASFLFTIGRRYSVQASDTTVAYRSVPLFEYLTFDEFYDNLPRSCRLVGVEYPHPSARPLAKYQHPRSAVYLLGSEDSGLSKAALERCHEVVYIPCEVCLNVAVAGSILLYDRSTKKSGY